MNDIIVLVLDYNYQPIEVISWTRAITLVCLNKVNILEKTDLVVRSTSIEMHIPSVVVKASKRSIANRKPSLNKNNLYLRDNFTCQYCGFKGDSTTLTVDHIVPRSSGGGNEWTNVTTACYTCNQKKAYKSSHECGMVLRKVAKEPSWYALVTTRLDRIGKDNWKKYY